MNEYRKLLLPINPKNLLAKGIKSYKNKLSKLNVNQMAIFVWAFTESVKSRMDEDKIANIACDFAEWLVELYPYLAKIMCEELLETDKKIRKGKK